MIEKPKADTKKAVADTGNKIAYAKADVNADVEKIKANIDHNEAEKKVDYARADIKADGAKAKADVENKLAHAKADTVEAKADIGIKMDDALK